MITVQYHTVHNVKVHKDHINCPFNNGNSSCCMVFVFDLIVVVILPDS